VRRRRGLVLAGQILRIPTLCHPSDFPEEYPNRSMTRHAKLPLLGQEDLLNVYGKVRTQLPDNI
jgi:hypothetical protein